MSTVAGTAAWQARGHARRHEGRPQHAGVESGEISRVRPSSPLTRAQRLVAVLVGLGKKYSDVAKLLEISVFTVKRHAEDAAAKLPGDLPTQTKLIMWVRGASREELDGSSVRTNIAHGLDPLLEPEETILLLPKLDVFEEARRVPGQRHQVATAPLDEARRLAAQLSRPVEGPTTAGRALRPA